MKKMTTSHALPEIRAVRVLSLFLAVLCLFSAACGIGAGGKAEEEELKTVRVAMDDSDLMITKDAAGAPVGGYAYEYIQLVASYAGWRVEYVPCGGFSQCLEAVMNGTVDLMYDLSRTPEREGLLLFPDIPMGEESYYLYCLADKTGLDANLLSTFDGKTVGITKDTSMLEMFYKWCEEKNVHFIFREFISDAEKEAALERGEIDITFEINLLAKANYSALTRIGEDVYYLAVTRGREDLLQDLNRATARIYEVTPYFTVNLEEKYFLRSTLNRTLSVEEREWVSAREVLRVGYLDQYLPISGTADDGSPYGIVKDLLPEMLESLGLNDELEVAYFPYETSDSMLDALSSGEIDTAFPVMNSVHGNAERGLTVSTSAINVSADLALAGDYSEQTVSRIAVNRGNKIQEEYTQSLYPQAEILYFDNIADCLQAVVNGEAGSTILNGMRSTWLLAEDEYDEIITIHLGQLAGLSFAVKEGNHALLSLLNRSVAGLDDAHQYAFSYLPTASQKTVFLGNTVRKNMPLIFSLALLTVAALALLLFALRHSRRLLSQSGIIAQKLVDTYDAIYLVDLDRDEVISPKCSKVSKVGAFKGKRTYSEVVRSFCETVDPKYRQEWAAFSDPNYLKQYMGELDSREYVYELPEAALPLRRMTVDVIERRNGEASRVLLSFAGIDDISAKVFLLQKELSDQHVITEYMLDSFLSVYYVGLDDGSWKVLKRPERLEESYSQEDGFFEPMRKYIDTEVHPEDREKSYVLLNPEEIKRRLAVQASFSFSFRLISTEPQEFLLCEVVPGADENHIVLGYKDITASEREKKERQAVTELANQQRHIKAFGDLINAALWEMIIKGRDEVAEVHWSPEFRRMFGYEDQADFPDAVSSWSDRLHPDDRERVLEQFHRSIQKTNTGLFVYDIKYRIKRKTGEYNWYHDIGRVEEIDGNTRRMYGVLIDIASDVLLEDQNRLLSEQQTRLENALEMAQSSNRAKTRFLFNMSHDIRTPMNAILGFTDMAKKNIDNPEKLSDCLNKTQQSGNLLLSLINSVLEMSRIEAGKAELNEVPGMVSYSFANVEAAMQELAVQKGIDLRFEFGEISDNYVFADIDRSTRVFLNLISNAIKYTGEGGRVRVRCEQIGRVDDDRALYRYTVEDNGCGMSEDFQKRAFEEFTRENSTTVSGVQGSGLGLAVVKSFVELMKGTIECKSRLGVGTVFTVTLSFRIQKDDAVAKYTDPLTRATVEVAQAAEKETEEDLTGRRVLLVEDNEINREIAMYLLEEKKILTEEAENGKEAVDLLKETGADYYDAILMDIQMPVMDGYEATHAIREMYPGAHLPIIALSANAFEEDKAASIAAGMDAHIAKPIKADELYRTLSSLMRKRAE